ncbi:Glutathione S-transferase 1, isoform C, partial [Armadillidium nasatum]
MTIDFYWSKGSPRSQAALLTIRALELDVNFKEVKMYEGEQVKTKFLSINPEHCLPTIVDGDFKLWESRVISTYLVSQYGKNDNLYPKDAKSKASVDRLMYFDSSVLNARFADYI